MMISVNASTMAKNNNTVFDAKGKYATNYVANHTEKQSVNLSSNGKKVAQVAGDSTDDKLEEDRMLRKMQLSNTRLDALGEYLGAMQGARRDSGSNGFVMFRRVTNLMGTQEDYKDSENYKNKKVTDTFISDQVDALRKMQKELMEEAQARQSEQIGTESEQNENTQETEEVNVSADSGTDKAAANTNTTSVSSSAAQAEKQQAGAKVYQNSFANQKRSQMAVNWNSMI